MWEFRSLIRCPGIYQEEDENLRTTAERVAARSIQSENQKQKDLPLLGKPLFHGMEEAEGEEKKGRSRKLQTRLS